jgi:hypothetical protein
LREIAGINASGFRRATVWTPGATPDWESDVSFSYGTMQAGDIIGPCIFDYLQKVFDAMRWTVKWYPYGGSAGYTIENAQYKSATETGSTAQERYENAAAAWPAAWADGDNSIYGTDIHLVSVDWDGSACILTRRRKDVVFAIADHVAHTAEGYLFISAWYDLLGFGGDYYDFDSMGATEGAWHKVQEFSAATTNARRIDRLSYAGVPVPPDYDSAKSYATAAGLADDSVHGVETNSASGTAALVLKWDFDWTL